MRVHDRPPKDACPRSPHTIAPWGAGDRTQLETTGAERIVAEVLTLLAAVRSLDRRRQGPLRGG